MAAGVLVARKSVSQSRAPASSRVKQPAVRPRQLAAPVVAEPAPVQAKLEVSEPGDALEHEADVFAERVMRSPAGAPAAGGTGDDDKAGRTVQHALAKPVLL